MKRGKTVFSVRGFFRSLECRPLQEIFPAYSINYLQWLFKESELESYNI